MWFIIKIINELLDDMFKTQTEGMTYFQNFHDGGKSM